MDPAMPSTQKEMKNVNILMDDITEEDLKLSIQAKRRHSCLPDLLQSDYVNPSDSGGRHSAHLQSNKKEPWYPISI